MMTLIFSLCTFFRDYEASDLSFVPDKSSDWFTRIPHSFSVGQFRNTLYTRCDSEKRIPSSRELFLFKLSSEVPHQLGHDSFHLVAIDVFFRDCCQACFATLRGDCLSRSYFLYYLSFSAALLLGVAARGKFTYTD